MQVAIEWPYNTSGHLVAGSSAQSLTLSDDHTLCLSSSVIKALPDAYLSNSHRGIWISWSGYALMLKGASETRCATAVSCKLHGAGFSFCAQPRHHVLQVSYMPAHVHGG